MRLRIWLLVYEHIWTYIPFIFNHIILAQTLRGEVGKYPDHYENTPIQIYRKFYLQKLKFFQIKTPRRGSSNEYPQPMFLSRNKKNNVYPCKPQFYYIKVEFKGVKFI